MTEFDPEKFEEKYVHYFDELQRAYKNAFEYMNDRYDSTLIHSIDQRVLSESEPFYENGGFRIDVPDDAYDRIQADVVVDRDRFEEVFETYLERIRAEMQEIFGIE